MLFEIDDIDEHDVCDTFARSNITCRHDGRRPIQLDISDCLRIGDCCRFVRLLSASIIVVVLFIFIKLQTNTYISNNMDYIFRCRIGVVRTQSIAASVRLRKRIG
jgi:hypothetical protein